MKSKLTLIAAIILLLALAVISAGCDRVKTSKDYIQYIFDPSIGEYVECAAKVTFDGDEYAIYNVNEVVTDVGTFESSGNKVTFIPERRGDNANQIAAATTMYVTDEFLIPTGGVASRITETLYEDKDDLEGVYSNGIRLEDEVVYGAADNSGSLLSYTEKMGTYEDNRDFIVCYGLDGTAAPYLVFSYDDGFGNKVCALTQNFYSYKSPNIKKVKSAAYELEHTIFAKNGSGVYNLAVIAYPDKEVIDSDVTYTVTDASGATFSGSTLTFAGTGTVNIECQFDGYVKASVIYIANLELKAGLTADDKTFDIGDWDTYSDFIGNLCTYNNFSFAYESVSSSNPAVVECDGILDYKAAGTATLTLTVRYYRNYLDGSAEEVTLSVNVDVTVE